MEIKQLRAGFVYALHLPFLKRSAITSLSRNTTSTAPGKWPGRKQKGQIETMLAPGWSNFNQVLRVVS